jgi:hypothetical protein
MSNITPSEIITITAAAFGVDSNRMCDRYRGNTTYNRVMIRARLISGYMIVRHTLLSWRDVADLFAFERKQGHIMDKRLSALLDTLPRDKELNSIIAAIEDKIDEVHECRVAIKETQDDRRKRKIRL